MKMRILSKLIWLSALYLYTTDALSCWSGLGGETPRDRECSSTATICIYEYNSKGPFYYYDYGCGTNEGYKQRKDSDFSSETGSRKTYKCSYSLCNKPVAAPADTTLLVLLIIFILLLVIIIAVLGILFFTEKLKMVKNEEENQNQQNSKNQNRSENSKKSTLLTTAEGKVRYHKIQTR